VVGVALIALAGCKDSQVVRHPAKDTNGLRGATLDHPYTIPSTTFTDTGGNEFNLVTSTRKPVTLFFFGYTNCPDVCNAVLADIASALTKLDDAVRQDIQVLFITTDPARDDGPAMRKYLDRFDPTFVGLTAQLRTIKSVARTLGVAVEGMKRLPSGGYEVGHSAQVIGAGRDDKAGIVWTENTSIGDLAHDLGRLVELNR
jgi:protein SCO1/2